MPHSRRNTFFSLFAVYLAFLLWFQVDRLCFLFYHHSQWAGASVSHIFASCWWGLRLDNSAVGYLMVLPFLFFIAQFFINYTVTRALKIYALSVFSLLSLLNASNLELYTHWGIKVNAAALSYLLYPREALASSMASPWHILLPLLVLQFATAYVLVRIALLLENPFFPFKIKQPVARCLVSLVFGGLIFLSIRGALGVAPINQSSAYYSSSTFLNHAAVNTTWNLLESLSHGNENTNPYEFMPLEEAEKEIALLYKASPDSTSNTKVLTDGPVNVVLVIIESFTGQLVESLGGEKGVTPHFENLVKEGLLFDSIYCSGERTDKGLVALLSGFPTQVATSVAKYPEKFGRLPHLGRSLSENGYHNSFYYGGDAEFYNFSAYLRSGKIEDIVDENDIKSSVPKSKWGHHDHVVLNSALEGIAKTKSPFFTTILTLTSHPPFELPVERKFKKDNELDQYYSTAYYTSESLYTFYEEAKKQPWFANTVFIFVADHGYIWPPTNTRELKYRIPLLWCGGALKEEFRGKHCAKLGGQTDLATTLLSQLAIPHTNYKWSKNLLDSSSTPFAFYGFYNAFGWVDQKQSLLYDMQAGKTSWRRDSLSSPAIDIPFIKTGKAYLQLVYHDFLKL